MKASHHQSRRRTLGRLASTLAASLLLAPALSQAQNQDIIFAISAATGSVQQLTAAEFTKRANEKLAGKATVKLFDNSQLGKDKDLMQKLKLGSVHLSMPSSIMSSISDEFALFDMPFLVKDRDHVAAIVDNMFWKELAPKAEAKGYRILGVWENGVRNITNNSQPINKPEDLAGLKIRTPKSKWRVKMFETWGANPTPMSFSEVFVALQTGVMDGQENPNTNIWNAKFQEVQKYLSVTGHVYTPSYLTTGAKAFTKLDPAIQKVLTETGLEMQAWARKTGAEDDAALQTKLEDGGMMVNTADREAFVKASTPIYAEFAKEVSAGQALIDSAMALAK